MAGEGLGGSPMTSMCGADLVALLVEERDRPDQALTEVLLEKRSAPGASPTRDAADRLLRAHAPWALNLAGSAAALVDAAGDERARRLFVAWSLRPDGRSQSDLATEEGVSAQRVGQIVQSGAKGVRQALTVAPGSLRWAVRALRDRLGAVATDAAVAASLADLGAGSLGAEEEPVAQLVLWLAGPYLPVPRRPGWMAVEPRLAVNCTTACLAADGGVRRLVDVESELEDLGIRPEQLVPWLAAGGAVVVHDLAVLTEGSLPDAVERLLDAHGVARAFDDLAADLAVGGRIVDADSLDGALRSRRFARSARGAIWLTAWGSEGQRQTPKKDRQPARPVLPTRSNRHGVDPKPTDRLPEARDRLWLWVKVDDETLRGAEADVPVALVEGLGLTPPARRTFSSRWGPVTLAYDGTQPTRGSVRAVTLAAGAHLEDTLLLGFCTSGDVAVEVRPAAAPAGAADEGRDGPLFFPEVASGGTR